MAANNSRLWLVIAAALLLVCGAADATVMKAIPFDEKVDRAEAIVMGKCTATRSEWDASHRWILTYSTFSVEKSIKGTSPAELTLVTPGGAVEGLHQDSIGVPAFAPGDEQVIFVKNTAAGPTVLYFEQGAYGITTNDRGEKVVAPADTQSVHVDTQRGVAVPAEAPRTMRDFEGAVRESIARTRQNQMELLKARQAPPQPSFLELMGRYKLLLGLALAGAALASWRLLRRS